MSAVGGKEKEGELKKNGKKALTLYAQYPWKFIKVLYFNQ